MAESNGKESATPEADNALIFRAAMSNIFKSIVDSVSEEEFSECLTFLKSKPTVTHKLHKVMAKDLYESMHADLETMLTEGNLSDGLGKVKKLSLETNESPEHIAWRPPGDVFQHLRTPDAERIREECERLQKDVEELETENNLLLERVKEKRAVAQQTEGRVSRAMKSGCLALTQMDKSARVMQKYFEILNNE